MRTIGMQWKSLLMAALIGIGMSLAGTAAASGKDSKLVVVNSPAEFDAQVLKATIPCVVDFYADWCPPCQKMLPIMDKLASKWAGKVKIVKVNVDKNSDLSQKYGVNGIPDVRIFVNGKQAGQYVGLRDEKTWNGILTRLLEKK